MSSLINGNNILIDKEITNITKFGFWILVNEKEYFVSLEDYPAFKKASIEDILQFKLLSPDQLYWEKLDIDIELDSLENPHKYPLMFRFDNF